MNEKKATGMLADDMLLLKLPPISEKVLQAVRKQKQKYAENAFHDVQTKRTHKKVLVKYIFAAMAVFLVVSSSVVAVISNNRFVPDTKDVSSPLVSKSVSTAESQSVSVVHSTDTLERVNLRQLYGTAALSERSEPELETLLANYTKGNKVYEDERYLYNFNAQGRLIEVLNTAPLNESGIFADEQSIQQKSLDLLTLYFPDFALSDYNTKLSENKDARPHWSISFTKMCDDHTVMKIMLNFDEAGELLNILTLGTEESAGNISRSDAIKIALQEVRSGKYNIPAFSDEDVEIAVEIKNNEGIPYYIVFVHGIPLRQEITIDVIVKVNSDTGEIKEVVF